MNCTWNVSLDSFKQSLIEAKINPRYKSNFIFHLCLWESFIESNIVELTQIVLKLCGYLILVVILQIL